MDWEWLRAEIKKHGLRHSTLMAEAPYGNSSKPSNSTPGIEPPRNLVTTKKDNKVKVKQVVPEYSKYKNYYTTAWGDDFNNIDYFKFVAIMQKFIDQGISTNQYADMTKFENEKYPLKLLELEYLTAYKYGLKTLYYQNFKSEKVEEDEDTEVENEGCGSGGCEV
jgi:ribonucleoside-diphosphate reductase alpha chain